MLPAWAWFLSISLAILPLFWLPIDFERPSDFAAWFLYLCLVVPWTIIIFVTSSRDIGEIVVLPVSLVASFCLFDLVRRKGVFRIPRIRSPRMIFTILLPITMAVLSIIAFSHSNYKLDISFAEIYDRRMNARDVLQGKTIAQYLLAFLKGACLPIAMVLAVHQKKWHYLGLVMFSVIAVFNLEGSKGTIMLPFVVLVITCLALQHGQGRAFWLIGLFISLMLASFIESALLGTSIIAAVIVRREMAIPGLLTNYYWEYFSNNQLYMMQDSIAAAFLPFESPYDYPKARLIGYEFFGNIETNANANIWASAFADFGYVGIIIVSILAALIVKVFDSLSNTNKFVFGSVCCSSASLLWVNGALHTSLLTGGILFLIVALWLYPAERPNSLVSETDSKGIHHRHW